MKDLLAGCVSLRLVLLSLPISAAGPVPTALVIAAEPLQVKIQSNRGTVIQPGQSLILMSSVKDANGNAPADPIRYTWGETSGLIDLSPFVLTSQMLVIPSTQAYVFTPGQTYQFTLQVTAGEWQGTATCSIAVAPKNVPPAAFKVNLVSDPVNRTIRPGQPLALTAELQPAGGGVSPELVTYAWSVSPALRVALPNAPVLKLTSTNTQGMRAGQAYTFALKVKIGQTEVPTTCTVNVQAPEPILQPNRLKVPVPVPRPVVKP